MAELKYAGKGKGRAVDVEMDDAVESEGERIRRAMNQIPDAISNEGRICSYAVELVSEGPPCAPSPSLAHSTQAHKALRESDFKTCRDMLNKVLNSPVLPYVARVKARHLLSGVCPLDESVIQLDAVLFMTEQVVQSRGGSESLYTSEVRRVDAILRVEVELRKFARNMRQVTGLGDSGPSEKPSKVWDEVQGEDTLQVLNVGGFGKPSYLYQYELVKWQTAGHGIFGDFGRQLTE